MDVSKERLPTDASKPVLARLADPAVSDEVILMYAYHFEHSVRAIAAGAINSHERFHLVPELLKSKDPRARRTALDAIITKDRKMGRFPDEQLTPEIFELVGAIVDNPDEAWWVSMGAMKATHNRNLVKLEDRLWDAEARGRKIFVKYIKIINIW